MVYQSKDKVPKESMQDYRGEFLDYLGLKYRFITILDPIVFGNIGDERRPDLLIKVHDDKTEDDDFIINLEPQSTPIDDDFKKRIMEYAAKVYIKYDKEIMPVVLGFKEPYSRDISLKLFKGQELTIHVISFNDRDAEEVINKIKDKIDNNKVLNSYDVLDLTYLQFMNSPKSQEELFLESCEVSRKAKFRKRDRKNLSKYELWFLDETLVTEEGKEKYRRLNMDSEWPEIIQEEFDRRKEESEQELEKQKQKSQNEMKIKIENIAKNFLKSGASKEEVAKNTGLSITLINQLI